MSWLRNLFEGISVNLDASHAGRIRLTAGVMFIVLALSNLIDDSAAMASGRWSWLYLAVQENFGSYGWPIFQSLAGILLIAWAFKKD